MMKRICLSVFALFALTILVGPAAQADVLLSNLNGNDGTQSADLDNLRNKGMGFTMPSGLGYTLDKATLRLETFGANVQPIVQVWDDVAGLPGTPLITLNNPTFSTSGIANYDFTPGGTFTLDADMTYWLVAYGTATGDRYDWKASSPAQLPSGLATHVGALFDTNGPPPTTSSSIICSYAIEGTIVPEPSVGLGLACVGALAVARRRR
ncbi:MAG: PEP-CTERM sorting domain-containing protein [Planctomycetes bacterium]|nr:PEP-CTERM sorting domain-containing protein [Planctomycetota bacterium]